MKTKSSLLYQCFMHDLEITNVLAQIYQFISYFRISSGSIFVADIELCYYFLFRKRITDEKSDEQDCVQLFNACAKYIV